MQEMEALELLTKAGAYKQGHFKLSSGLHSKYYLQCALVLQDPVLAAILCKALAKKTKFQRPDLVIGPALGGVVFAYEMARAFGAKALFAERNEDGKMVLRRGFMVKPGDKVIIAEDVLTTGKSVNEVIDLLKQDGITPVGTICIADRSTKKLDFGGVNHESLVKISIPTFDPADCPLCKEGIPLTKPGSRK